MILSTGEKFILVAALTWAAAAHLTKPEGVEWTRLAAVLKRGDLATLSQYERQAILAGIRWAAMQHDNLCAQFSKELQHTKATAAAAASRECARIADLLEKAN